MNNSIKIFAFKIRRLCALILFACLGFVQAAIAQDSKGTEFWICFPGNIGSPNPVLFITGEQASTVTISIPGLAFNQVVAVPAGGLQEVSLPTAAQVQTQFVTDNKGIHITATTEVTVYGMNAQAQTTDAFLAFPVDALGKDHFIMGYNRDFSFPNPTQATVVATENNTTVTITTTVTGGGFTTGVPQDIVLQQGEAYQLRSLNTNADYSGTRMVGDKPISVFGGAQCTNISGTLRACDHLVEQLPPLEAWGASFVTVPLATRTAGDVFRFLAQNNGTAVSVNGVVVATLDAGEFHETILGSTTYNRITSNEPILVGQYSRSSDADGVVSDPFFALVPPDAQFLNFYTISAGTSNIPNNFVNITSPTSNIGTVEVDGAVVGAGLWNPIPGTTFSGAKVPISVGVHRISSTLPIGVLVYGFGSFDSYGYLGGQSFSPVATVNKVTIDLQQGTTAVVGTQYCLTATATDQDDNPLEGIRVDFNVAGANPMVGFAFTDVSGVAEFCYTGNNDGVDSIVASVESIADSTTITWIDSSGCTAPTFLNNLQIVLDASCGMNDGNISIIPLSGAAPFMYSIDGGTTYVPGPDAGWTFQNLAAGTYHLRLKDANGCESNSVEREVQTIYGCAPPCTAPTFLNNLQIVLDATCGMNDGNISIIPTSGTGPFMYSIDGGATYVAGPDAGFTFTGLAAGAYQLRLKSGDGCESAIVTRTVDSGCPPTTTAPATTSAPVTDGAAALDVVEPLSTDRKEIISTYPNPSRGQFRVQLQNFASPKAEVSVFDGKGTLIQKNQLNLTENNTVNFDLSRRAPGLYYIKIVSKNGTKLSRILIQ